MARASRSFTYSHSSVQLLLPPSLSSFYSPLSFSCSDPANPFLWRLYRAGQKLTKARSLFRRRQIRTNYMIGCVVPWLEIRSDGVRFLSLGGKAHRRDGARS